MPRRAQKSPYPLKGAQLRSWRCLSVYRARIAQIMAEDLEEKSSGTKEGRPSGRKNPANEKERIKKY